MGKSTTAHMRCPERYSVTNVFAAMGSGIRKRERKFPGWKEFLCGGVQQNIGGKGPQESVTYKELKETEIYLGADVVEIYSAETGEELDDRIPEEKLNNREVVEYRRTSGFLSIVLKS